MNKPSVWLHWYHISLVYQICFKTNLGIQMVKCTCVITKCWKQKRYIIIILVMKGFYEVTVLFCIRFLFLKLLNLGSNNNSKTYYFCQYKIEKVFWCAGHYRSKSEWLKNILVCLYVIPSQNVTKFFSLLNDWEGSTNFTLFIKSVWSSALLTNYK